MTIDETTSFVAERVRTAMKSRGVTRKQLAPVLGLSERGMGRKVNGDRPFMYEEMLLLCAFLGRDLAFFGPHPEERAWY